MDDQGTVIACNRWAEHLLGYDNGMTRLRQHVTATVTCRCPSCARNSPRSSVNPRDDITLIAARTPNTAIRQEPQR
ncbi:hypothetical protein [Streptomyces sp. NPDC057002]|uniref:hypothetical protein n=1 Tax=Streptomyces sp. NPDC057002 TaxID=3345992 RepID=UPI0036424956